MRPRIFVTNTPYGRAEEMLQEVADITVWKGDGPISRAELLAGVADVEGLYLMIGGRIDDEVLDAAPKLQAISLMSAGTDAIDLDACKRRGIPVGHTPDVLTGTTADIGVALLLAGARRISEGIDHVRADKWRAWQIGLFLGSEVTGSTVGIVGGGRIGAAVARRMAGFDCEILVSGRPGGSIPDIPGAEVTDLPDLLERSDHVVLTVPLTEDTHHLIDAAALARMRPTAGLVNIARGKVVDTDALVDALDEDRLAYAGLDVTDPEPMRGDHPLVNHRKATVVPHIGSATHATRAAMGELAAANLVAHFSGMEMPARAI